MYYIGTSNIPEHTLLPFIKYTGLTKEELSVLNLKYKESADKKFKYPAVQVNPLSVMDWVFTGQIPLYSDYSDWSEHLYTELVRTDFKNTLIQKYQNVPEEFIPKELVIISQNNTLTLGYKQNK